MITEIFEILKKFALIGFVIGFLTLLGSGINRLLGGFNQLAEVFALIRAIITPFSYFNDNDAFIQFIGYLLSLTALFWSARAGIAIYKNYK